MAGVVKPSAVIGKGNGVDAVFDVSAFESVGLVDGFREDPEP